MDRTTDNGNPDDPSIARVDDLAQRAHQATDRIADMATEQVGRLSGTAHRAVNSTADAASTAAEWASSVPTDLTEAVSETIRARPIATVVGALFVGYLLGRLAS
jgi:ElaB/YqjD/DUF883 family membrane-anchored ribosome-binding protein